MTHTPTVSTYLSFHLRLASPVIVSTLSGEPNSAATQGFIPGSAIRGAFAARLLADGVADTSDEFKKLILSDKIRFLHAYPSVNGTRSLPTPLSWKRKKGQTKDTLDLAGYTEQPTPETDNDDLWDDDLWPQSTLVSVSDAFVAPNQRHTTHPKTNARFHQQRDREVGRAWKETKGRAETTHGAVFAYEYLEAEQMFSGLIQLIDATSNEIERVKKCLQSGPLFIGRSKRAGYGGEAYFQGEITEGKQEHNNPTKRASNLTTGDSFRLLFTSAYIGRHPLTGQTDPTAIEHEISERFEGAVEIERRYWAFEYLGGFNRKWRLEIPQSIAVRGGSVLVLKAKQDIPRTTLEKIEHAGLGGRRNEGFGRLLFLQTTNKLASVEKTAPNKPTTPTPKHSDSPRAPSSLVGDLEKRLLLTMAQQEIASIAQCDLAPRVAQIPTNSLLGRLRSVLRTGDDQTSSEQALSTLALWCGDGTDALKQPAKDKLKKCFIKQTIKQTNKSLFDWLKDASTPSNKPWERLLEATEDSRVLNGLAEKTYLTTHETAQTILQENATSLLVYLLDTTIAELAKRNRGVR